jgi:hypothetical protein
MGSVAFFFEDILKQAATISRIKIGSVIKGPMSGLIRFHSEQATVKQYIKTIIEAY